MLCSYVTHPWHMCCITKTHRPSVAEQHRRDTGRSNMNLVGPVSPGTKQPTRKEDPRSAHTRSTFQPQNSSSQSNQCPDCPPIHTSGCHHDRVVDMQIVITTRLSHSSQLKQCGRVSCQIMGFVLAAWQPWQILLRARSGKLSQRIVSRTAGIFISFCSKQTIVLCTQESAERLRKRRVAKSEMFLSGFGQGLGR